MHTIEELPNGDVVVGGWFSMAGGQFSEGVARWGGTSWNQMAGLGSVFSSYPAMVYALKCLPNGDLVAGGNFSEVNGAPAGNLALWNGISWSPLTGGTNGSVLGFAVLPNGDLVVGGGFSVVDGVLANSIAQWNGTTWSPLGGGVVFDVLDLAVMANGDLVVGGWFAQVGGVSGNNIARWDGSNWTAFGSGLNAHVQALLPLPNGDLLVGGNFTQSGSTPVDHIARWDGSTWGAVDAGCNDSVVTLAHTSDGDVVAGGVFTMAGGQVSAYLARLRSSCPATAVSSGSGCIGSAGPVELVASDLPWLGSTFHSVATALPSNSIALEVRGLGAASVALPSVLPQGVAGCTLQVTPDLLSIVLPSQGIASSAFAIPNSTQLLSAVIYQQVAPVEFGGGGSIIAVTASNALVLTIGAF